MEVQEKAVKLIARNPLLVAPQMAWRLAYAMVARRRWKRKAL